ncbi:USP [Symbiodinium natans]|uniref:USP protein n=1 Tax=Symbiodinium natans TaxID=878477 RepID=A0A812N8Z4_9DINO|nr:USP [Symbiodinium natans]
MSSIALHVALLSGEQKAFSLTPHSTVGELREVVQKEWQKPIGKLISASGARLLESATLTQAGIRENEVITAIIQDVSVAATRDAFAAIRANGTVVTWGCPDSGGDCSAVKNQLQNVQRIQATCGAFAAILENGSVVSWGHADLGGDSSDVQSELQGVCQIQAAHAAFAAIKVDGSVVTWGAPNYGGDCSAVRDQLASVQHIQSSLAAFAALRADGRVVTWGSGYLGGDSSDVRDELRDVLQVAPIFPFGFAAIKAGGRIVCWGGMLYRGVHQTGLDSIAHFQANSARWAAATEQGRLALSLRSHGQGCLQVPDGAASIVSCTFDTVAILQKDGTVQFWGCSVPEQLRKKLTSVVRLRCGPGDYAMCAAIRSDGSVVAWQYSARGALSVNGRKCEQLQNVTDVQVTRGAFAALRTDGTVVTWGSADSGGDSASVQGQLKNVVRIQAGHAAFAAIRSDGSVVSWGDPVYGGDSSRVRDQLGQAWVETEAAKPRPRVSKPKAKPGVLKKPSKRQTKKPLPDSEGCPCAYIG